MQIYARIERGSPTLLFHVFRLAARQQSSIITTTTQQLRRCSCFISVRWLVHLCYATRRDVIRLGSSVMRFIRIRTSEQSTAQMMERCNDMYVCAMDCAIAGMNTEHSAVRWRRATQHSAAQRSYYSLIGPSRSCPALDSHL